MALQLDRLVSLSRLPTVSIGVLPLDRLVPDGAYHTFLTYGRRMKLRGSNPDPSTARLGRCVADRLRRLRPGKLSTTPT